jgi:two-component system OmpR family response regulator
VAGANRIKVLIVEDDAGIRGLLTTLFKREGWSVTTAGDGDLAAHQIIAFDPHVIILDLLLPKMSGLDLLRQLKSEDSTTHDRIIVLTAIAAAPLRAAMSDFVVWTVMHKPFDNAEMMRNVRACAGGRRQVPGAAADEVRAS